MNESELTSFRDKVLRECQECIATNPVIILGSGASAPFGLPTMDSLGNSIIESVEEAIAGISIEPYWQQFKKELASIGLEPALQKGLLNDRPDIYRTIIQTAWVKVAGPDVLARRNSRYTALIRCRLHPFCVNYFRVFIVMRWS